MTIKKGGKRRGAKPGNTNTTKGPRLGRKDKPPTSRVARTPLPQPQPGATLGRPTGQPKTGGRDFEPGTNSHDGEVFQRGRDRLPRGNMTLFNKIVYHDAREEMYKRDMEIIKKGKHRDYLTLRKEINDRVEGTPVKKIEKTSPRAATFILTAADGSTRELLPPTPVGSGASPAASAEDALILGLEAVR